MAAVGEDRSAEQPKDIGLLTRLQLTAFAAKPLVMLAALLLLPLVLQFTGAIRLQAVLALRETQPAPFSGPAALANAVTALRAMAPERLALAGEATQEGHWRFVNRAGETVTASSPEEMKRAFEILAPEARPSPSLRLDLLLTPETLFERRAALAMLPVDAQLSIVLGSDRFNVVGARSETSPLYVEVRPNVLVELAAPALVREALFQLSRPIDRAAVRILALEVGGPSTLAPLPRKEPGTGRPLIDMIDPASLVPALGAVRGQTLVVTGRVDRDVLYVQPSSGAERGVRIGDLLASADAADVNLVVLESASTPRQPGGRNWLWQRVEVKGLEEGLNRPRFADVLNAVGGTTMRFVVKVSLTSATRTQLDLVAERGLPRASAPSVGELFMDAIGDLTGRVVTSRIQVSVASALRQRELDRRVLPFLPSWMQLAYVAMVLFGLAGWRTAAAWWGRVWPNERAEEYANAFGYLAARAVRAGLFWIVFLPAVAVLAAPAALMSRFRPVPR